MRTFNLLGPSADDRVSEVYGLAPYLVYKVGDKTYNYGQKAMQNLFYTGALSGVNPTEIISIGAGVSNLYAVFRGQTQIRKAHCRDWDFSAATDISRMFYGCTRLVEADVSRWNLTGKTSLQSMFVNCYALQSIDGRKWDTSSLTQIDYAFSSCIALKELGLPALPPNCNTGNILNGCSSLTDVRCGGLIYPSLSFSSCPLTAASVIDILDHLADTPDAGATITFRSGLYATYSAEDKARIDALRTAAVANGWTIANMS